MYVSCSFEYRYNTISKNILDSKYGSLTVTVPQINTTATGNAETDHLASFGSNTFISGTLNVANIAARLSRLPPLNDSFSKGFGPVSVGYDYNLLTANAFVNLNATQGFGLFIQDLPATLSLLDKDGQVISSYDFKLGHGKTIDDILAPDNWSGNIRETVNLNATLTNTTFIQFEPGFEISSLGVGVSYPGGSQSLGPLTSFTKNFDTVPITIYNNTFALKGFESQVANFSTTFIPPDISTPPIPPSNSPFSGAVPEPSNILGVLLGGYTVTSLLKKGKTKSRV